MRPGWSADCHISAGVPGSRASKWHILLRPIGLGDGSEIALSWPCCAGQQQRKCTANQEAAMRRLIGIIALAVAMGGCATT